LIGTKQRTVWRRALFILGIIVVAVLAGLGGIGLALGLVNTPG